MRAPRHCSAWLWLVASSATLGCSKETPPSSRAAASAASAMLGPVSPPSLHVSPPPASSHSPVPAPPTREITFPAKEGQPHFVGIGECDTYQSEIACFWLRGGVDRAFVEKAAVDRAVAWRGRAGLAGQREAVATDCVTGRRGMRPQFERAGCAK